MRKLRQLSFLKNYALRMSAIYAFLGITYIILSDSLLVDLYNMNSDSFSLAHSLKGITFIIVTSIILYFIIRYYEQKIKAHLTTVHRQNKQLTKYAFHTSHNLRRPVANLLGLYDLVHNKSHSYEDVEMKIKASLEELDIIVNETNQILEIDKSSDR